MKNFSKRPSSKPINSKPSKNKVNKKDLKKEEEKNEAKIQFKNKSKKESNINRRESQKKNHKSPENNYKVKTDKNSNKNNQHNIFQNEVLQEKPNHFEENGQNKNLIKNNNKKPSCKKRHFSKDFKEIQKINNKNDNDIFFINKILINGNENAKKRPIKTASSEFSLSIFKSHPKISLMNVGKTSYINVTFQNMANMPSILKAYLENKELIKKYSLEMELSYYFTKLLSHLFPTSRQYYLNPYSLEEIYGIIIKLNPSFKGKSTKNVIDFLLYFLDSLHEEDKNCYKKHNYINNFNCRKEENLQNIENYYHFLKENGDCYTQIFKIFSWINKKCEVCWDCKTKYINYQFFFTYDLNFENAFNKAIMNYKNEISIFECIKFASEEQTLYNKFCEKCNKKNNFTKISNIYSSSKYLILLLRGIEKTEIMNNKIKIKIDQHLDLSNFIKSNSSCKVYSLYGIIFYDSINSEYISYSICPFDNKWYLYINEEIRPAELKNIINIKDYKIYPVILFYKHSY